MYIVEKIRLIDKERDIDSLPKCIRIKQTREGDYISTSRFLFSPIYSFALRNVETGKFVHLNGISSLGRFWERNDIMGINRIADDCYNVHCISLNAYLLSEVIDYVEWNSFRDLVMSDTRTLQREEPEGYYVDKNRSNFLFYDYFYPADTGMRREPSFVCCYMLDCLFHNGVLPRVIIEGDLVKVSTYEKADSAFDASIFKTGEYIYKISDINSFNTILARHKLMEGTKCI